MALGCQHRAQITQLRATRYSGVVPAPICRRHAPARAQAVGSAQSTTSAPAAPAAQAIGRSYVNFEANPDHFKRVIARLAAAHAGAPSANVSATSSLSEDPVAPVAAPAQKPWTGILAGLLGGRHSEDVPVPQDLTVDDGSPLRRCVVMFTATWCGPCSMVHKELQHASGLLTTGLRRPAAILVIDVDVHSQLATEMGVKALPTLLYLGSDAGKAPLFTQGPVSSGFILDMLDRAEGYGGHDLTAKWLKL
ncbi:hypothetical protein HXX76_010289 [Chlamydomonas incerta]|uniref:Thioredoxin domain-containing protein n=1 Tax=Chlamydomonas incerta TaxID=51695 RepID=A0A835T1E3_CHLIN|nr:hypothetical protein HXX76_010289 [Chlamydomonas incerta]|eukprot:KAG2430190.1 hypothetical protein HXX76_010289 [Chlamydomonas incerta]